jgi:hypothetical protein
MRVDLLKWTKLQFLETLFHVSPAVCITEPKFPESETVSNPLLIKELDILAGTNHVPDKLIRKPGPWPQ